MWQKYCQMWVGIAQCDNKTVKCEKNIREPPNVTKKLPYMMLKLHNVRMKISKNVKKKKGTAKCDNSTVKCDVGTTQYENVTVKYEKK